MRYPYVILGDPPPPPSPGKIRPTAPPPPRPSLANFARRILQVKPLRSLSSGKEDVRTFGR